MAVEVIKIAKTVEEAVAQGLQHLGKTKEECIITVLDQPKKGLFGLFKSDARVKITVKEKSDNVAKKPATKPAPQVKKETVNQSTQKEATTAPTDSNPQQEAKLKAAVDYLRAILDGMEMKDVQIVVTENGDGAVLTLEGEKLGILIGRHGETLDSLQYIVSLVCNRADGDYYRISLDCGNYRAKREESLKELAQKVAAKVKRTGRSQMLEPMNPYERRMIHATVSAIEGVASKSKGEEPNRRIIIVSSDKRYGDKKYDRPRGERSDRRERSESRPQRPYKKEPTMEELLKADRGQKSNDDENQKRYSKIEL